MIDVERLKTETDLLSLLGRDVTLRRIASTQGGEYAGPCPFCHSGHRIHVQPATGLWFCRFCCEDGHWQDAIEYVMRRDGVDFPEACRRLGAHIEQHPEPRRPSPAEVEDPVPSPIWRKRAGELVARCEETLWSDAGTRAREWLNQRGLADDTLKQWGVGFNPADYDDDPKAWGVTDRDRVWIPRGVVIPWVGMGDLWQVKVRRATGEPKYPAVAGGHPLLFGADLLAGRERLLLTEGELDAMLAWQECRDLVDVATLGSCTATPRGRVLPYLLPYRRLLIAYDLDEPGERAAGKWSWTARALRVRPPLQEGEGKDLTDFVKVGGDLRAWVGLMMPTTPETGDVADRMVEIGLALLELEQAGQVDTEEYRQMLQRAEGLQALSREARP